MSSEINYRRRTGVLESELDENQVWIVLYTKRRTGRFVQVFKIPQAVIIIDVSWYSGKV